MLHPRGEAVDGLRVVRGVLDRLGQQGQRADRGLELVGDVGDEVPADRFEPAGLGDVCQQQRDGEDPAAGVLAQGHGQHGCRAGLAAEPSAWQVDGALARPGGVDSAAGDEPELLGTEPVAVERAEALRGGVGQQDHIAAVDDHDPLGERLDDQPRQAVVIGVVRGWFGDGGERRARAS